MISHTQLPQCPCCGEPNYPFYLWAGKKTVVVVPKSDLKSAVVFKSNFFIKDPAMSKYGDGLWSPGKTANWVEAEPLTLHPSGSPKELVVAGKVVQVPADASLPAVPRPLVYAKNLKGEWGKVEVVGHDNAGAKIVNFQTDMGDG